MHLLIVDDEAYTREGLMEAIDWPQLGITELMEAKNGQEALNMIEWFQPDIVLTDIKMPQVDGIEFAEKFVKKCPNSQLLFMSAYMDTQYLKKAIKLSAVDFIEKPIMIEEVETAVTKAIKLIQKHRKSETISSDNIDLQKQKLVNLLIYKTKDLENVYKLCRDVNFPTEGKYTVILYQHRVKSIITKDTRENVIERINEFWNKKGTKSITSSIENHQYVGIVGSNNQSMKILSLIEEFVQKGNQFNIGVGFEVVHINAISESFQTALSALGRAFYRPEDVIYTVDEKMLDSHALNTGIYAELYRILKEEPTKLPTYIDAIFAEFMEMEYLRKEHVQMLAISFSRDIIKEKAEIQSKLEERVGNGRIEQLIQEIESLQELKEFLKELVYLYLDDKGVNTVTSPVIRDVMNYIVSNCTNMNLNLQSIADYFNLSVGYLSWNFKQETNGTLRQYIENCRIERSKQKLENGHLKIHEVAEECGFSTSNYFSRVFKDVVGVSPLEYRQIKRK